MRNADSEGVLGLVAWALRIVGYELPTDVAEWTRERMRARAMQQLQARASLRNLLAALEGAGVRCAPFKGPFLAERFYPQGVSRPSCDLDILIDPSNREHAEDVLRSIGYRVESPAASATYERFRHEIKASSEHTSVELHLNVNDSFGVRVPTAPFLDRASCLLSPELGKVGDLDVADALLLVTVHASSSLFVSAKWLMDVKMLWLAASSEQVRQAIDCAKEHQILSAFVFGLEYAEQVGVRTAGLPRRASWRARHQLAKALRPAVRSALAQGRRSPMPLVHLLLSDSLRSVPELVVLRAWDHLVRG